MDQDLQRNKLNKSGRRPIVLFFWVTLLFLCFISGLLYYEYGVQTRCEEKIRQEISYQSVDWVNSQVAAAYAELRQAALIGGAVILIYLLFISLAFLAVNKNYLRPLKRLRQDVDRIIKSDYEYKIKPEPNSEFSYLYDFLKRISNHFQENKIAIENANVQRGKELDKVIGRLWKENLDMNKLLEDSRLLEEKLKQETDFANAIISCMDEGLFTSDTGGKVTFMNPSAERILEISGKDAFGKSLDEIAPLYRGIECKEKVGFADRPIMKSVRTGKTQTTTLADSYCFLGKLGKRTAVVLASSPLLKGDKIIGAVSTFRDVNVEQRLDEAKNGFISIASHQMRTPLTSMRWFAEMLIHKDAGKLNKEQSSYIKEVYQGIERMTSLLDLLLQIARIEAGRVKIKPTAIDFKKIISDVAASLGPLIDKKKQKLIMEFEPENFPAIPMDKDMVWQVFFNLLSNASRYAPANGVIRVTGKISGQTAEFSVTDKGIGIPKDSQDRIFNKFYRSPNAIKHVPEGSGLGLYLVKSLVEGWGGQVWFKSPDSKGTTFYFTIPLSGMEPKEGEVTLKV
jgi:signal transduction histidine kinase